MSEEQDLVTRCPSCSTSFRVTSEQIHSAGGAVRCGACLRIFQAEEYLALERTVVERAVVEKTGEQPDLESLKESEYEGEVSEGEQFDDVALEGEGLEKALEEGEGEGEREGEREGDEENLIDESERLVLVSEAFVREEIDEKDIHEKDIHGEDIQREVIQKEQFETEQFETEQFESEEKEIVVRGTVRGTLPEEVIAEKYSAEVLENKYWQDWEDYLLPLSISTDSSSDMHLERHLSPEFIVERESPGIGLSEDNSEGEAVDAQETELAERISNLELGDEPENFPGEVEREKRPHPLWFAATILLLISGALQYLWFNKDVYSQQAEYRPYYQMVCARIGCELPEYKNARALVAKNLLIRTHPQYESALMVDAILHNSASYRQEFPDLRLMFRNIENTPIAARQFSPSDYLAGELRGLRYIPANTEVRFSIEISDPGKNALGYSLEVLPQG